MPVQIPSLNRIAPQEPDSIGRISTAVVNTAPATEVINKAAGNVINEVSDYQLKLMQQAADVKGDELNSQYEIKRKVGLEKLREIKGDPTNYFIEYEKSAQKDMDDILAANEGISSYALSNARAKMNKTNYAIRDNAAVLHASLHSKWDDQVTDKSIDLLGDTALRNSEFVTKDAAGKVQPGSLSLIQQSINDVKTKLDAWGERKGLLIKNQDGTETRSDILKEEIKSRTSKILKNVVETLNNTGEGKTDEAEAVMKYFKNDIDAETETALFKHHANANLNKQASAATDVIMAKYPNDPVAALRAAEKTDSAIKDRVMDKVHTRNVRRDQAQDMVQKRTFEEYSTRLDKLPTDKRPLSLDELEQDPFYQKAKPRMDHKQIKAIEEQVLGKPKFSDTKAQISAYKLMTSDELKGMDLATIKQQSYKLNEKDSDRLLNAWKAANTTTDAEKRIVLNQSTAELEKQMRSAGLIEREFGGRDYDQESMERLTDAKVKLNDALENFPPGTNPNIITDYIKNFVADFQADKVKEGQLAQKYGKKKTPTPTSVLAPTPTPEVTKELAPWIQLPADERQRWINLYNKVRPNGEPFSSKTSDMNAFRREHKL